MSLDQILELEYRRTDMDLLIYIVYPNILHVVL